MRKGVCSQHWPGGSDETSTPGPPCCSRPRHNILQARERQLVAQGCHRLSGPGRLPSKSAQKLRQSWRQITFQVLAKPFFLATCAKHSQMRYWEVLVAPVFKRLHQLRVSMTLDDFPRTFTTAIPSPCKAVGTQCVCQSSRSRIPSLAGIWAQKARTLAAPLPKYVSRNSADGSHRCPQRSHAATKPSTLFSQTLLASPGQLALNAVKGRQQSWRPTPANLRFPESSAGELHAWWCCGGVICYIWGP